MSSKIWKKYKISKERLVWDKWVEKKTFEKCPKKSAYIETNLRGMVPLSLWGKLHLWQAYSLFLQDVLVRSYRSSGNFIHWLPNFHHSAFLLHISAQDKSDNINKIQKNKDYFMRENLRKQLEYSKSQLESMWISCDYKQLQFTLSEEYQSFVRRKFLYLLDQWFVSKENQISYWNKEYQTIVWDTDIRFEKEIWKKYRIRYFVDTKKECLIVVTHRPDTIFADVALAVNPLDKRYRKLVWKKVIIPIVNQVIPLIADERVDMTKDDWVIRITPWHDALSLIIAKDHGLPLDQFAIDPDGNFTDLAGIFSGKKLVDFFDNIVQYLDDISNLDWWQRSEHLVPYCKKTWVVLETLSMNQWFVHIPQVTIDLFSDQLAFDQQKFFSPENKILFENLLQDQSSWCISRQYTIGSRFPIWYDDVKKMYIITHEKLKDAYKKSKKTWTKLWLSYLIFSLILDGYLQEGFDIEDLVWALFAESMWEAGKTVMEVYLTNTLEDEFLVTKVMQKERDKLLELVELSSDYQNHEKLITELLKYLEKSFLVKNEKWWNYVFKVASIVRKKTLTQEVAAFDSYFYGLLYLVKLREKYPANKFDLLPLFVWWNDHVAMALRVSLLNKLLLKEDTYQTSFIHNLFRDRFGNRMSFAHENGIDPKELVDHFGSDALRLALLHESISKEDIVFDTSVVGKYSVLINKLRNACRYIILRVRGDSDDVQFDLKAIQDDVEKNKNDLHVFEVWILYVLEELRQEMQYDFDHFRMGELVKKVIKVVEHYFCWWFLEISKIHNTEYTDKVLLLSMSLLLKLVHPFLPFVSQQIWDFAWFDWDLERKQTDKDVMKLPEKNYKIHLFMDIISKSLMIKDQLWCRKHEVVTFLVQATPDFLDHVRKYSSVVEKLLKAQDLLYFKQHETIPDDFLVDYVIDINVAIKKIEQKTKQDFVDELKEQLSEKEEYLQYLRILISSAKLGWQTELASKKEDELQQVKHIIESIKYELSKINVS